MFKVTLLAVLMVIAVSGRRGGGGGRFGFGRGRHGKFECADGSAPTCTDGSAPVFDGDR